MNQKGKDNLGPDEYGTEQHDGAIQLNTILTRSAWDNEETTEEAA